MVGMRPFVRSGTAGKHVKCSSEYACGSRKLIATRIRQMSTHVIMPLAAHSDDATHPLPALPRPAQAPAVGLAAAPDNPCPAPGACANDGNTGSTRPGAA